MCVFSLSFYKCGELHWFIFQWKTKIQNCIFGVVQFSHELLLFAYSWIVSASLEYVSWMQGCLSVLFTALLPWHICWVNEWMNPSELWHPLPVNREPWSPGYLGWGHFSWLHRAHISPGLGTTFTPLSRQHISKQCLSWFLTKATLPPYPSPCPSYVLRPLTFFIQYLVDKWVTCSLASNPVHPMAQLPRSQRGDKERRWRDGSYLCITLQIMPRIPHSGKNSHLFCGSHSWKRIKELRHVFRQESQNKENQDQSVLSGGT